MDASRIPIHLSVRVSFCILNSVLNCNSSTASLTCSLKEREEELRQKAETLAHREAAILEKEAHLTARMKIHDIRIYFQQVMMALP